MRKQLYINGILRTAAIMVVAVLCLVACKKQESDVNGGGGDGNNKVERTIIYTVGHCENQRTVATEAEWDALLEHLCDQAQSGNEVIFFNMSPTSCHAGRNHTLPRARHLLVRTVAMRSKPG